jgi:putative intracellular protease/amidase
MTKIAYLYVFDTMSDWETGYLVAELNSGRYFKKGIPKYMVKTIGLSNAPITTMGGIRIIPDCTLEEFSFGNAAVLILPGGNTWLEAIHKPILAKARECIESNRFVAAICGATLGLAEAGILDNLRHTSNNLDYLKTVCPNYKGEAYHQSDPAVTDGNLITASGIAPLEFAYQVLKLLDVFTHPKLEAWYNLNHTKNPQYFFALMENDDLSTL